MSFADCELCSESFSSRRNEATHIQSIYLNIFDNNRILMLRMLLRASTIGWTPEKQTTDDNKVVSKLKRFLQTF